MNVRSPGTLRRVAVGALIPLLVLGAWEYGARNGLFASSILPAPSKVAIAFEQMLFDGSLGKNTIVSIARLLAGLISGSVLGITIGLLVATSRRAAEAAEPLLTALIPIPGVAWIPLLIIFFGIEETTKILLLAIGSACVLYLQTVHGVRGVDRRLVEVGVVLGKTNSVIARRILLPGALPAIFAGLNVALALSWTLLVASEMIASSSGLGWLIWNARNFSRADEMLAGMACIAIVGKATELLLKAVERRALRWRPPTKDLDAVSFG